MSLEDYKKDKLTVEIKKSEKEIMEKARKKREAKEAEEKSKKENNG